MIVKICMLIRLLILSLTAISFIFITILPVSGQDEQEKDIWKGYLADKTVITKQDLSKILEEHEKSIEKQYIRLCTNPRTLSSWAERRKFSDLQYRLWMEAKSTKADLDDVNLSEADLSGVDLRNVCLSDVNLFRIDLKGANLFKANLGGSDLTGANLSKVDLREANLWGTVLTNAILSDANLSGASMLCANLANAYLTKTNLKDTWLFRADLSTANLSEANLRGADLQAANLSNANLSESNLTGATLIGADLTNANLHEADLSFVIFEPAPGTLPNIHSTATSHNLSLLKFKHSPHALVALRKSFTNAGYRKQEREITYAIKHTQRHNLWQEKNILSKIDSIFNFFMFEITCRYGMSPGRPLLLLASFILFFSFLYIFALKTNNPKTGIFAVRLSNRVFKGFQKEILIKLTTENILKPLSAGKFGKVKGKGLRLLRIFRITFYFSLLSAFHLGWRDINVGNWLTRMQRREYTLRATGWPRTLSGIQSLISAYLLALWVLSYFGRPFE